MITLYSLHAAFNLHFQKETIVQGRSLKVLKLAAGVRFWFYVHFIFFSQHANHTL